MDKCEWKELKVDNLPPDYFDDNDYIFEWRKEKVNGYKWDLHITITDNKHMSLNGKLKIIKNIKEEGQEYRYLKPEEKPLIVKSGETWAAHWKGVDYLLINPKTYDIKCLEHHGDMLISDYPEDWKPFSEIELTDEIALLRPKIVEKDDHTKRICTFVYLQNNGDGIVIGSPYKWTNIRKYQLATIQELEPE